MSGWVTVQLLVASFMSFHRHVDAGCSRTCCTGTDLTCSTLDWRMDRVYGTCYCDENCVRTQDCCFDYSRECLAQPCVLSEWSHWSGCAQPCQPSYRVRTRSIEREPRNSGQACPVLEERSGCMEYQNHEGQICGHEQAAALITTVEFSKARAAHGLQGTSLDTGFCVEFKLLSLTRSCEEEVQPHTRWTLYLREGFVVCVACQPPAISNYSHVCQGDGSSVDRNMVLHWQAVGNSHCTGTWSKVQRVHHCSCPQVHTFIFI